MKDVQNKKISNMHDFEVQGIAYDSRRVKPGYLFVALKGSVLDGHDFIDDAVSRGARGIVVEEKSTVLPSDVVEVVVPDTRQVLHSLSTGFYNHPAEKIKIVGITGTHGKTTTSFIIRAILESCGYRCGLIGTINYRIGERIITSTNTTPESLDLQRFFKEMNDENHQWCSMEVSSHSIAQKRIEGVSFDVGIFMNITRYEHLDYHRNFKSYLLTKLEFFSTYLAESPKDEKCGIVNLDDRYANLFIKALQDKNIDVVTFGRDRRSDIRLLDYHMDDKGSRIDVSAGAEKFSINTRMKGVGNIYNILAGISFAKNRGIPLTGIIPVLEGMEDIPGRFEVIDEGQPFHVVVDYAHTHHALRNLLLSAREMNPARIILVFGCGGDRDRSKRPLMGKIAARLADIVLITSDNPRNEDPGDIIRDIERGVPFYMKRKCLSIPDRGKAIREAVSLARRGDCLIIAGKGHETFQLFRNTTVPFDDREEVKKALKEQGKAGDGIAD